MIGSRQGISIRWKLALLAGVPVIGALLLSWLIVSAARQEAQAAAAIGSIEDLTTLASKASTAVHHLQNERALVSRNFGQPATPALKKRFEATDAALDDLNQFFGERDVSKLPKRLARDLGAAHETLDTLKQQRAATFDSDGDLVETLDFYGKVNDALIGGIGGLMQLSDDGELLRGFSSLLGVLRLKESASEEHAVLANVFQHGEFAPGVYKVLVTLVTEQEVDAKVFRESASDETLELYDRGLRGGFAQKTSAMRQKALDTVDDEPFGIEPEAWFSLQGAKIDALRKIEEALSVRMRNAALNKLRTTRADVNTSFGLTLAVLLTSILLAWFIARGVTHSVSSLSRAATRVREEKDFSVRADKVSSDELGVLTEAFNEMLSGLQERDAELESHRQNLENLVAARTAQLQKRNEEMRVVLDNVEEGLAMIAFDGALSTETSASFRRFFGAPAPNATVASHMQALDDDLGLRFRLGWESITDDFLPWQLALEQMPHELSLNGRHYRVNYRPIVRDDKLQAALMVSADITDDLERERRAAEQHELITVFEHVTHDRSGFMEFLGEADRLVGLTRAPEALSLQELMRVVHTIKGNCGLFGVQSVVAPAHDLESFIIEQQEPPAPEALAALHTAWEGFHARVRMLLGDRGDVLELQGEELDQLISSVERHAPYTELSQQLQELRDEPVQRRFVRLTDRAKALAKRLGKGDVVVEQNAGKVRLPVEPWAPFWGAFVHVLRNAVDHGVETPEERRQLGKSTVGKLRLSCTRRGAECIIELGDDGRGIDWARVAAKARERGLPHATHDELLAALMSDGVSTRDEATDTSGRGVGMSAVLEACRALGGRIEVQSQAGVGTTWRFVMPYEGRGTRSRSVA